MENKVVGKNEEISPENLISKKINNGPIIETNNDIMSIDVKKLQESIRTIPESTIEVNLKANEIKLPDATTIDDNFNKLQQLKQQNVNSEEEHRKKEFEERLNYLLNKLDIITKINDK